MKEALQRAIKSMSSADPEKRVTSATEIHHLGRGLAYHAVFPWFSDQELSKLLGGHSPAVTVGLAVTPERFEKIREANGLPRLADVPPDQDAREFELHFPGGLSMDILTTKDPAGNGAIAKFLQKSGEGIQQVEFRCEDVTRATQILQEKFCVSAVYPAARPGADGTHVNFFLISAPGAPKVLIELYEPAPRID
jgi:methylmalonyl-CoA/ethylmalonyl-CoA epimerase